MKERGLVKEKVRRESENSSSSSYQGGEEKAEWSEEELGETGGGRVREEDNGRMVLKMSVKEFTRTMENLSGHVDDILLKLGVPQVDLSDCNGNGFDIMNIKLKRIKSCVSVKECIRNLDASVNQLKDIFTFTPVEQKVPTSVRDVWKECSSIDDINNKTDFVYRDEGKGYFECEVCQRKVSEYGIELESDFRGKVQSSKFRNTKMSLKYHLEKKSHTENVEKLEVIEARETREENRSRKVGLNLGLLSYYLLHQGRPESDYTTLVDILDRSGSDVGDLNHSFNFVRKWSQSCSRVIERRVQTFFSSRLPQTGQKPKAKVNTDSATWQHRTRDVVGLTTVVPDSPKLIQSLYIKSRWSLGSSGAEKAKVIVEALEPFITGEQYQGLSADGGLLSTHAGDYVAGQLGVEVKDDLDPMHAAGRVDARLRALPKFKSLTEDTDTISAVYRLTNLGKEFLLLFQANRELREEVPGYQEKLKLPRFFSETRLPNYASQVYEGFLLNYPVIVRRLAGIQEENWQGSSFQKNKALKAADLQNLVYNLRFFLSLAGRVDVYKQFRRLVNVVQVQLKNSKIKPNTLKPHKLNHLS